MNKTKDNLNLFGRFRQWRRGRMGGPKSAGPGGYCVCPNCGNKVPHKAGQPCFEIRCAKCDTVMTRQD